MYKSNYKKGAYNTNRVSKSALTLAQKRAYIKGKIEAQRAMPRALPANFQPTGEEIKAIDIPAASYTFRTPAGGSNIILLNGIQTGTGFFNRIGARIEMKSLKMRGTVTQGATSVQMMARVIIVYDRQPTGALPVITDILQSRDQTGAATTTGGSEINLDNRDRFTIIKDHQVFIPSATYAAGVQTNGPSYPGGEQQEMDINCFIKLKGLGVHYRSTANPTTIADIATGALYAVFVCTGTDSSWGAGLSFRLRYNDK